MNIRSNRRSFLKSLGVTGAALATSGALTPETASAAQTETLSPAHSGRRFGAKYMGDFAAPKLQTVRWGAIGVGARGSGHVQQLAQIEGSKGMMMENCNYGREELMFLNMCRQGVIGELLHGEAAYLHELRGQMSEVERGTGSWRTKYYSTRNDGNLYPTHGLGPVAQYGMDFIMLCRIVECLRNGEALDQNTYEGAFWSAVRPLSAQSEAEGGAPQVFPDFTRGGWQHTKPLGIVA